MPQIELYTPRWIAKRVRATFLHDITLDPASCLEANRVVRAERYYTADIDGLSVPWGTPRLEEYVYVNPPYGRAFNANWAKKIQAEWQRGCITQMAALTHDSTGAAWYEPYLHHWRVTVKGRVADFWGPDDQGYTPRFNSTLVFYGTNPISLYQQWHDIGYILPPIYLPIGVHPADYEETNWQLGLGL